MEPASLPEGMRPQGIARCHPDQQKPLMKILGKMMTKRLHLPHGKISQQSIKIKQKKVKYY